MRHFKALRTRTKFAISSILGLIFVLITFGCNASRDQVSELNFDIKAEAVPEGICVTFENIPPETTCIFISFSKGLFTHHMTKYIDETIHFSGITGDSLEQVKKTGRIVFPFVQSGEVYHIFVRPEKGDFQPNEGISELTVECLAKSGIYFSSNAELKLDDTHTGVTLSSEPVFSSEVIFDTIKYDFSVNINLKQTETEVATLNAGYLSTNDLFWVFEPELIDRLKIWKEHFKMDSSAFITAYYKIIYDNIAWNVEIAKTPEFTFSF